MNYRSRLALLGVVLVATGPILSACGMEAPDETSRERSPVQGAELSTGAVQVRDAYITYITSTSAPSPAPSSSSTTASASASPAAAQTPAPTTAPYLVATFVNSGTSTDALIGVTTPMGAVDVGNGSSGELTLPPGLVVSTGTPTAAGGHPLKIDATGPPVSVGLSESVTFTFANAGTSQTVQVPIVANDYTTSPTSPLPVGSSTETPEPSGESAAD